ncbi:serine/threonine-protein kinase [Bacillus ectoiniformans]|uniref:serine/threonine-protein kinase n=1 Tax=Bacillus ectoiniformans TaxID=1494429 RepID=UPI00195648D5|nr:serine/threonine-protein kinase [Bacillus ectoiniformans]MBM7649035.1 serine/threonine-protein kinase [Bacillus ectoiniformans]
MVRKRYILDLRRDMELGDKYVLQEYVSEGTFGQVWRAVRRDDSQTVALKIPKSQEKGDKVLAEGLKLKGLSHPNLIQIYDMSRVDGYFIIEMEYFEGHPLSQELINTGISTLRTFQTVYEIFERILDGLEFMHGLKIAHGDIKPDNILIKDEQVKITDFGTSRLIEDIFVKTIDGAGTYAYIAPEVVNSKERHLNSDIYSLGAFLYQFLTGQTPHDTFLDVIHNKPFPRPRELNKSIPEKMEQVILKALARDPDERYQTVVELRNDFKRAVEKHLLQETTEKHVPKSTLVEKRDALELAITNCKLGKFKLAEKILQTEIANDRIYPDLLLQLSYVYFKTDRRFEALKTIEDINVRAVEETRRENFTTSLRELKARILFAIKKFEEAQKIYQQLVQQQPDSIDYRYRLAICFGLCNQEDKAIEILEAINQETPGVWVVVKKLGLAYEQKREYEKARGYFKYALKLNPDDREVIAKLEKYDFYL